MPKIECRTLEEYYLFETFKPEEVHQFLQHFQTNNVMIIICAPNALTDKVEPLCGGEYSVELVSAAQHLKWLSGQLPTHLGYPAKNPFIPENFSLVKTNQEVKPEILIQNQGTQIWFQQDHKFKLPKAYLQLNLYNPSLRNLQYYTQALVFAAAVNQEFLTRFYDAIKAGIHFYLDVTPDYFSLEIFGYSDKLPEFAAELMKKMALLQLDQQKRELLLDALKNKYENNLFDSAARQAYRQYQWLSNKKYISSQDIYAPEKGIDYISFITAADLSVFSKQLIDKGFVKGIVYGNLEKKGATELVSQVLTQLNYEPEYPHYADSRSHIALREGTNIYLHQNLTKNNAMVEVTEIGYPTISKIAKARLLEIVLDKSFYQELRTNRQLGYFVKSFAIEKEDYLGQAYVIDSEKTSPNDAYLAVQEWKQKATQMIETMSDASFFDYQQSLIVELTTPPQSMSDYCSYFYYLAIEKKGNFDWRNELAASLKQLSKDEFTQFACQILNKSQSNSLAVFSSGSKQQLEAKPGIEVIRDGSAFKQLGKVIEPSAT